MSSDMERRVITLEVHMEQVGKALASIDAKLDKVNDRLMLLPTKAEVGQWKLQWTALSLAVVAIIIGGIIGGLGWIKPDAPAPVPTTVQQPSMPATPPQ